MIGKHLSSEIHPQPSKLSFKPFTNSILIICMLNLTYCTVNGYRVNVMETVYLSACDWLLILTEKALEWKYINYLLPVWPWRGHFTSGLQQTRRFELYQNKRRGRNFKGINTSFWLPHCMLLVGENKPRWRDKACVLILLNEGEIKYFRRAWAYFSEIQNLTLKAQLCQNRMLLKSEELAKLNTS